MAANDGTSTELFPGWSSVVHQPAEEPEERDLPSTVDIAALNVEPSSTQPNNENSDSDSDSEADSSNSTDASQTCSQSDSSDSEDTSTSSQGSSSRSGHSSPSPEFSVTSSQTGLCLTIRKQSPTGDKSMNKQSEQSKTTSKSTSSSSDSGPSSDSDSESEKSDKNKKVEVKNEAKVVSPVKDNVKNVRETRRMPLRTRARVAEKKEEKVVKNVKKDVPASSGVKTSASKVKPKPKRTKKMASLPLSRGSTYSSSDSDDSDADSAMLASCSLQEIRQEDLAAILPDQQEIDAFDFECNRSDKNSPTTGDMSGSDMELPQQAVNALIQRTTESSSEGESHAPPNPNSLYANSLLQQFVAQTQMLNAPCPTIPAVNENIKPAVLPATTLDTQSAKPDVEKKRRGRPKKAEKEAVSSEKPQEYCTNPNVSPDSGIQNSPDHVSSPEPSLSPSIKQKSAVCPKEDTKKVEKSLPKMVKNEKAVTKTNNNVKQVPAIVKSKEVKEVSKIPVTSNRFDRVMYGNADRVLYPPRRKAGRPPAVKKGPGRPPKHRTTITTPEATIVKPVEKSKENQQKVVKGRMRNRPVLSTKNRIDKRNRYQTLKVPKLMHSKHKHKKHKKYKFKVFKPMSTSDPKINIEIDKLIADFIKYCAIATKQPKENVPEQIIKTLKKVTKKRKTTEEKKKKKQNVSTTDNKVHNSNEQRLPLKKRHYHMVNNNENKTETEEVKPEPEEGLKNKVKQIIPTAKVEKPKIGNITPKNEIQKSSVSPRHVPVIKSNIVAIPKIQNINNNEYEVQEATKTVVKDTGKVAVKEITEKKSVIKETPKIVKEPVKPAKEQVKSVKEPVKSIKESKPVKETLKIIKESSKPLKEAVKPVKEAAKTVKEPLKSLKESVKPVKESVKPIKESVKPVKESVKSVKESIKPTKEPVKYVKETVKPVKECTKMVKEPIKSIREPVKQLKEPVKQLKEPVKQLKEPVKQLKEPVKQLKEPVKSVKEPVKPITKELSKTVKEPTKVIPKETTKTVIKDSTKKGGGHIDGAIEVCVTKLSKENVPTNEPEKKPSLNNAIEKKSNSITTTPKKRHRLELTNTVEKVEKLTAIVKEEPGMDIEAEKPKISIESLITELKVKRNLLQKSSIIEDKKPPENIEEIIKKEQPADDQSTKLSPESAKKKVRKRRAINRTGFPTVKKRKKKPSIESSSTLPMDSQISNACDRVPKEGEEYTKFVQRTEKSENSISTPGTPEKLKIDESSRWEVMSECESLPMDERTEFDEEMKSERMTLRQRDLSPSSVDTRSSERSKFKLDDPDDLELSMDSGIERLRSRLEDRTKRKRGKEQLYENNYPKRKLRDMRDISPASSIEPFTERRLKEDRASTSGDEKRGRKNFKWRKRFLVAGLFSDYYKEDDETKLHKRTENANKPTRNLTYNPSEHPYGLLPPPYHCGKFLRCRKIPFQLPYDIWWQHTHSQLPGKDSVPSWNYRKIRTNVYNIKNTTGACEPQACNCKPSSNCGDDCINRLVYSECPASHRCLNQKIQRHEGAPGLEKFMTDAKGWGVKTKLPIKQGEFILEYVGEVVADQEFKERMGTIYTNDTHHYCLHLDGGLVIDGHRMGGDGRFVNHSCAPNCEMQKWSVNGQFRMALFSLRDIQAGEELTYDYNFSLFNPAEGQECKCGSDLCRGVIGGKTQRVRQLPDQSTVDRKNSGRVGRPRKTEAKKKSNNNKEVEKPPIATPLLPILQVKPVSHQQKIFILEHHCFLLRNLTKVRKVRDRSLSTASAVSRLQTSTPTDTSTFINQLNALQKPRNMKTRRLAQAEDDPELNKTVKLATLLKDIWTAVTTAKDDKGSLLSTAFMTMPSKRKVPEFYTRLSNPLDLTTIEQNVATGVYKTAESFDDDFNLLFRNYIRFYGRTSEMGIGAAKLKKIYTDSKRDSLTKFEDTLGEKPPSAFVSNRKKSEEEDIIRCICGIPRDEGLMIQCERCMVWQHCECVKADASAASYHCEVCVPRKVDYEIPMNEFTEHGHRYYMTLMRGDLQLRQGDTVYVLRDIPIKGTDKKHTYDTIGKIEYSELDIFRIERLWKEEKTGKRLAYGHHYLRPHETFHEPTRKFFPNEVMRVPLYEAVPVELVISPCWVMDINTYCKGRPIGAAPEHIYICEYRVDKGAKIFSKVAKTKFSICTKSFAFEHFETRLKVARTYCPHDVDEALMKSVGKKRNEELGGKNKMIDACATVKTEATATFTVLPPIVRTPAEQKTRLNKILLNLLGKMPTKQTLDVSYLLEGGRRRKKQQTDNATSK
ncbi:histone-lysine N-methyltransferase ash1 isoform X1 [Diabrotica virgifera virgifera]|uniref:Histone-lysine N-methyltransferase ash1 n=1 Tax=Diabrotica virgifera virgifera TaxID=50390 RepID=A0ABM5K8G1_DIAVI|nr:histone-lysine N-methyltransferase ash1 isoform X1 [Diabrotica virgifera virgifera]